MIEVEGPDGSVVEFPDNTPPDTIKSVMAKSFPAPQQPDQHAMPQAQQPQGGVLQTLKDSTQGIAQGATLGFGDEIMAAGMAPFGMLKRAIVGGDEGKGLGQRFSDNYSDALAFNRGEIKKAKENSPIATTAGEITGGLLTAGGAQKAGLTLLNAAKPTVANMALRGAGEGAAYGLLTGFGQGEGFDDRKNQAVLNALIGAGTGAATGGLSGWLARNAANKTIPSANAIRSESDALFKFADDAGIVLRPEKYTQAVDDIFSTISQKGFHPKMHGDANTALSALQELKGQPITLQSIKTMRELTGDVAMSQRPKERLLGRTMRDKLDELVAGIKDADVIVKNPNVKVDDAIAAIPKARDLWAQMKRSETITDALARAERQASGAGSGGNIDNAIRQKIKSILENPKRVAGFSDAEKTAMENIVKGTWTQNRLRQVGKLSPEGNGLSLLLHSLSAGAAIPSGGTSLLAQAPIAAAGFFAKRSADAATRNNIKVLDALIRSGGQLPHAQISQAQRLIIDSLLANQHLAMPKQPQSVR